MAVAEWAWEELRSRQPLWACRDALCFRMQAVWPPCCWKTQLVLHGSWLAVPRIDQSMGPAPTAYEVEERSVAAEVVEVLLAFVHTLLPAHLVSPSRTAAVAAASPEELL